MQKKSRHGLPKKRHRQGKTNYHTRLRMVSSHTPRLIVRKSLKNITAQLVEYKATGDHIITSASTKELQKKYNWTTARRNIPAAYLTGYLIGLKAKKANIKKAIFDTGVQSLIHGGILFACLKGAVDAGLSVPHAENIFPSQERIEGKHLKQSLFQATKTKIEGTSKK